MAFILQNTVEFIEGSDYQAIKGPFTIINVTFCLLIADKWVGGSVAKTPIADNFFISVFSAFYLAEEAFLSMF